MSSRDKAINPLLRTDLRCGPAARYIWSSGKMIGHLVNTAKYSAGRVITPSRPTTPLLQIRMAGIRTPGLLPHLQRHMQALMRWIRFVMRYPIVWPRPGSAAYFTSDLRSGGRLVCVSRSIRPGKSQKKEKLSLAGL